MYSKRILFYLRRGKKKEKKKREGQKGGPMGEKKKKKFGLVNGSNDFQLIYKTTIQQHYLKSKNRSGWVSKIHALNTII